MTKSWSNCRTKAATSEEKVRRVKEIMCRAMESVLVGDIPVGCEAALSARWNKKAKLIVKDGKV